MMVKNTYRLLVAAALGSLCSVTWSQAQETLIVDTVFQLKTADPARAFEPTASLVLHPVYETLVTFTDGDATALKPGLADLPTASEDATTFTFTLREGATFSDGTPVTADDVLFSLNRAQNVKGSAAFMLAGMTFAKGEADNQIVVTAAASDPGLPARLTYPAFSILNSDVIKANGGADTAEAAQTDTADAFLATASAGSGPYILSKWDLSSEVVLTRNEAYWGEAPAYDQIIVRNVANTAQQMNITRGVSQIAIDLRPDQLGMMGDSVNVISQPGSDMGFLFLNANPTVSEITSNPDFVEAVRYGVDFAGILNLVGDGAGRPGGIVPSILLGTLPGEEAPVRDVERAKAALARSGITNPTIDFSYASDIAKHGISFGDIGAKVQADLAEIGITLNLVPQPVSANLDGYRAGSLQMSVQWWGPAFPDPSYYLAFNPGKLVGLRAGWAAGSSAPVEELAATAAITIEPSERDAIYKQWQQALNENGPFIPLFQPPTTLVSSKTVANVTYHPTWTVDLAEVTPAQ
ncbi:peptide/nickel transport system substrate-binding protein [Devosia enhydra]|uniref:Peptide/nickel transport system substrate-binding protein n=1 Tax=Devosia enhydra TaxID=665118 RepID=A0A1K2HZS5_9HYPH|nr:ABC transporter substrate-binding protein [Devosia enhydra]SFZ85645.1 peptide/nickel transport system substrate-binding protein [Devosia enhydra]